MFELNLLVSTCRDTRESQGDSRSLQSLPSLNTTAAAIGNGTAPSFTFAQLISPPDSARGCMDVDNPFSDPAAAASPAQAGPFSDAEDHSSQTLSAFFSEEPRQAHQSGGSPTSQPWRIPPVLARKQSQALNNAESSPLRHSFSCRHDRAAERSDSFVPARRRLSVSSGSLDALNLSVRPCVTPRRATASGATSASAGSPVVSAVTSNATSNAALTGADSPLNASSLRHLSSNQAARIIKSDAGAVDPYVN